MWFQPAVGHIDFRELRASGGGRSRTNGENMRRIIQMHAAIQALRAAGAWQLTDMIEKDLILVIKELQCGTK